MTTKRWAKNTRKRCTKKEEKEVLEHLRKIGQYLAWLQVQPESPEINRQIRDSESARERWKARYKELVGR